MAFWEVNGQHPPQGTPSLVLAIVSDSNDAKCLGDANGNGFHGWWEGNQKLGYRRDRYAACTCSEWSLLGCNPQITPIILSSTSFITWKKIQKPDDVELYLSSVIQQNGEI